MTDRGTIFAAPMVLALLDDRKRQTRRLASSPLRRCVPGDRLWVREAWHAARSLDRTKPREMDLSASIEHAATARNYAEIGLKGRLRPGMHMPRWASRLTLIIEEVRFESLRDITEVDALAEGVRRDEHPPLSAVSFSVPNYSGSATAVPCFRYLWDSLHTKPGERWDDNPDVVALTFGVIRQNIDLIGKAA